MTRAMADQDLLRLWELGLGQHPLDRALTVLEVLTPRPNGDEPSPSRQELAQLALGERDRQLMGIFERIFGRHLAGQAQCPVCRNTAEFVLDIDELRTPPGSVGSDGVIALVDGGYSLAFRLPNSYDLAAVVRLPGVAAARHALAGRCTIHAELAGAAIDVAALPEHILDAMAAEMERCDPQADVELALTCPGCSQPWTVLFDVESFLWTKIEMLARRLLREVDVLARAYGWREADILDMSAARRQAYLELVS